MIIENTGLDNIVINQKPLDHLTGKNAFIRAGQWDYDRVTYDYKVESDEKNVTYYIRLQGRALEGDVDSGDAVIKLLTPFIGKHYYPHGVEYGEEENFPPELIEKAKTLLTKLANDLAPHKKQ
ncbi:hypothetical protein GCM10010978_09050 [Compostibacillus humi]|uniref:YugN-like family protein n=1 Tax=Compostibacillus humi TaxID=1245525 RepID=A0A8J2ZQI1_9BACI|nr:YugN family protein [Compostibacillus humi]GGH72271.1 hypothetical protein GCM10010978_09050 [Compostibacillus humi]